MSFFIRALFNLWVLLSLLLYCPCWLNHHQPLLHNASPLVLLTTTSFLIVVGGVIMVVCDTTTTVTTTTQGMITVGSMVLPIMTEGKVICNKTKGIMTPNNGLIHALLGRMSGASFAIPLVIQRLNALNFTAMDNNLMPIFLSTMSPR
jgi:hypothetical protein